MIAKAVRYVLILLLIVPSTNILYAQQVAESPGISGDNVFQCHVPCSIRYPYSKTLTGEVFSNAIQVQVLLYSRPYMDPDTLQMEKRESAWVTRIPYTLIDTSVTMILYTFLAQDAMGEPIGAGLDDETPVFYDLLVHDQNKKPVQGAYLSRALSYTGYGGLRKENLDLALRDVQNEIKLYPDHYAAYSLKYTLWLKEDDSSGAIRQKIENEIQMLMSRNPQTVSLLNFTAGAYRMVGNTEAAQKIENEIVRMDPKGDRAAVQELEKIMKEKVPAIRFRQLESFAGQYSQSRYIEFAFSAMASAAIESDDISRMITSGDRLLKESTSPAGASGLAGLAGVFAEKNQELQRAVDYAGKALDIIQHVDPSSHPPEVTQEEWRKRIRTTQAQYREVLGWARIQSGDFEEGISLLEEAVQVMPQQMVFYHLAVACQRSGDIENALVYYARTAAFEGDLSDKTYASFTKLWEQSGRETEQMETFLTQQEDWVFETVNEKILSKRNIHPAPDFDLENLEGEWVRLSDQAGSVTVLCFWASWSRSSRNVLQILEDLEDQFGEEVLFMTIAVDIQSSQVRSFVKQNRIRLPVLLNDDTDKAYSLQGVPVVFVIDKTGDIHFEHKGIVPDMNEVLTVELNDLLE